MHATPTLLALLALSAAASAAYGFYWLRRPPSLVRALVKAAAVGALAIAAFTLDGPPPLRLIAIALGLSALGDFLLGFEGLAALAGGILAFLAAQLVYVFLFLLAWMLGGDLAPVWPRWLMVALILGAVVGFSVWLWREKTPPGKLPWPAPMLAAIGLGAAPLLALPLFAGALLGTLGNVAVSDWLIAAGFFAICAGAIWLRRDMGPMRVAIMPYAVAITAMACLAQFANWAAWPAMLGAVLFVVSDGVLGAELFKLGRDAPARRWTAPVVWWTYYAAQLLIPLGLILAARAAA
ncbi:MAG: lysoplasmalogenase family protein [Hyphomonadaceae bacterium]